MGCIKMYKQKAGNTWDLNRIQCSYPAIAPGDCTYAFYFNTHSHAQNRQFTVTVQYAYVDRIWSSEQYIRIKISFNMYVLTYTHAHSAHTAPLMKDNPAHTAPLVKNNNSHSSSPEGQPAQTAPHMKDMKINPVNA